ncbi:hypothetical protein KI387_015339, partial [Taxus chinensis]
SSSKPMLIHLWTYQYCFINLGKYDSSLLSYLKFNDLTPSIRDVRLGSIVDGGHVEYLASDYKSQGCGSMYLSSGGTPWLHALMRRMASLVSFKFNK